MWHLYKTFIAIMSYLSVIVGLTVGKILQNYRNANASIAFLRCSIASGICVILFYILALGLFVAFLSSVKVVN